MVKKSAEIPAAIQEKARGGDGSVSMFNFVSEEEALGKGRLFGKAVLEPGSSIGYHAHEGEFEIYYILKGKALLNDNGREIVLEAGDSSICRNGESHSISNIGNDVMEFIAIILYA